MSSNTMLIITDSMGVPLGNRKENLDLLEEMGYKINKKNEVSIYGIAFSLHRTENRTLIVAHSHCKEPKKRDTPYYFIYIYDKPHADILAVLKDFVFEVEEEVKYHNMEISDIKESFFLFKSLKNVINNNQIPHNETKLIEVVCKYFDKKTRKPVQLEAGSIEKSVYFLVELCSKYKELNYIIHFINDPVFEQTGTIRVYIDQSKGDEFGQAKQKEEYPISKEGSSQIKFLSVALILLALGYWALAPSISDSPSTQKNISNPLGMALSPSINDSPTNNYVPEKSTPYPFPGPDSNQKTYTNSLGMDFVSIPVGEFDMGWPSSDFKGSYSNSRPVHRVKISNAFYMAKYVVTQKQWRDVMGTDPSYFKGDNLPVESVSWYDVQNFIKKLNKKEGGNKYRLPTEAEWEYSVRAGTTTKFFFGDNESILGDYAWYAGMPGDKTHNIGQKKPNPWGLYDMYGTVSQYVQDNWHDNYTGAPTDGSYWISEDDSLHVVRGGCFGNPPGCLSAQRGFTTGEGGYIFGFRLVMDNATATQTPQTIPGTLSSTLA